MTVQASSANHLQRAGGVLGAVIEKGLWLEAVGDHAGAVEAFRRGDTLGDGMAAWLLGNVLRREGDLAEAAAAFERAVERGDPRGAIGLADLAELAGDMDGHYSWRRRAGELEYQRDGDSLWWLATGWAELPDAERERARCAVIARSEAFRERLASMIERFNRGARPNLADRIALEAMTVEREHVTEVTGMWPQEDHAPRLA